MKNTFWSKKNLVWSLRKCFSFILDGKHFPEVVKNLEMLYYLLIISNLVLKLLITIFFFLQFHPLEFNFYINFGLHFYNCYLLFLYHFLIEIFYLSNFVIILFILSGKHFPEVVKILEISYYLLIISNLIFKLLIAIYFLF